MRKIFSLFLFVVFLLPGQKKKNTEKKALIIGSVAVVLSLPLDFSVRKFVADGRNNFVDGLAEFSNNFGDGRVLAPFVAFTGVSGLIFKDKKLEKTSVEAGESFIISGAIANAIKTITMRKRPSSGTNPFSFSWGNKSFPSGHVTVISAVSTVFAKEYGCKAFYAIPALTAFARIRKNAHWLSDTVAGFTLGYVVGSYVVRKKGFFAIYPTKDGFAFVIGIRDKNASGF